MGAARPAAALALGLLLGLPAIGRCIAPPDRNPTELLPEQTRARIAEIRDTIVALKKDVEKDFSNLGWQRSRNVQDYWALRRLEPERARLREDLFGKVDLIERYKDELDARLKQQHINEGMQALSAFLQHGQGAGASVAAAAINDALEYSNFTRDLAIWDGSTKVAYENEEKEFTAAKRLAEQRLILKVVGGGLGLLLLLALVLAARYRRAKNKIETDYSKLVSSPAAVYLGVQTPARPGSSAASSSPATILAGNYLIEKELGRGGMGVVYEATDLSLRRKVAIKRVLEQMASDVGELELLLNEARLVAALKHPHIVEIYSIFKEEGHVYLVFELVTGQSLDKIIRAQGRIPLPQSIAVVAQIGHALAYAHAQKVIHRDLKPGNVMITAEPRVKVMDFGLARQSKATAAGATRTAGWGTPPYMAPEQELGTLSRSADIYALGVCFYEMLTGALPFGGPNFLAQKTAGAFAPATQLVPGLAAGVDAVIAKALQPDPAKRYQSVEEMVAAVMALTNLTLGSDPKVKQV